MTKQIVTQTETHKNGQHSIKRYYWDYGHIIKVESDDWNDDGTSFSWTKQEHELFPWTRTVSLEDFLTAMADRDVRIVS